MEATPRDISRQLARALQAEDLSLATRLYGAGQSPLTPASHHLGGLALFHHGQIEEGIVALLEPFIDTVVVCSMTALVIVITGAYADPAYEAIRAANQGAALTSMAMQQEIPWFTYVLSVAVFLFAFSTMISWSYYGERCWAWLFGDSSSMVYRILFLVFGFLGSIVTATNVLDFSDLLILGMAFPNILGVLLLSGSVRKDLDEYTGMLKSGEIKPTS